MLNLASLVLGLGALAAPVVGARRKKGRFLSFGLCLAALLCQFWELARRVHIGDFAAVADTIRGICIAACVLSVLCMAVNLLAAGEFFGGRTEEI